MEMHVTRTEKCMKHSEEPNGDREERKWRIEDFLDEAYVWNKADTLKRDEFSSGFLNQKTKLKMKLGMLAQACNSSK